MIKGPYILAFLCLAIVSCEGTKLENEKKQYYPIDAFLERELSIIDSMPIAILKYHQEDQKSDTSIVEKKEFREIVRGLLLNELTNSASLNDYEETVLEDIQLDDIIIGYSTEKKNKAIKKIELHVRPGSSKIKSLYAERYDEIGNTQIVRKLLWTSNKQLLVASTFYSKIGPQKNITDRFNWSSPN